MTQAACVKHPPRLFSQGDEELKASQTMNQSINTHPSTLLVSQWGSANRGTVWLDECTDACSIDGNMVMTVDSVEYSSNQELADRAQEQLLVGSIGIAAGQPETGRIIDRSVEYSY